MCEQDNVGITLQVLNTAEGHFNEDVMQKNAMGRDGWNQRVQFGGVTIAMVIGLTMQDTGENALAGAQTGQNPAEIPGFSRRYPVRLSPKCSTTDDSDQEDAGIVTFKHYGVNQRDQIVFEGERTVLIKRRSHYADSA